LIALTALFVAGVSFSGCGWLFGGDDAPLPEGETCLICVQGGKGPYHNNACKVKELPCKKNLECLEGTGTCERRLQAGEPCDHRSCDEGLLCDVEDVCNAPGPAGTICSRDEHCVAGLICNFGATADPTRGACAAPEGAEGAPCMWRVVYHGGGDTIYYYEQAGCAEGLGCAPEPRPTDLTPATLSAALDCNMETDCWYAGTCVALGVLQAGEACLDPDACESGICEKPLLPPLGLDQKPRRMAWSGLCHRGDALPWHAMCDALRWDPEAPTCGAGLGCAAKRCTPYYSVGRGDPCGPPLGVGEGGAPPPLCYVGGACVDDDCADLEDE